MLCLPRHRTEFAIQLVTLTIAFLLVMAARCPASMVGMVVSRSGNVVVESSRGGSHPVDGFARVDVGYRLRTGREGGQLLLFDNTRAQLLPGATYRLGRSGVFKSAGTGCILVHEYQKHFPVRAAPAPQQVKRAVGTIKLAEQTFLLRPGAGWQSVAGERPVAINDVIHIRDGGGARVELAAGGVIHLTGPAQAYLNGRGIELEIGRILVNGTSQRGGISVGTPTAEIAEGRTLFGVAAGNGLTKVRTYGGKLRLANRCGTQRQAKQLIGLCQGAVDGRGVVTRRVKLVAGDEARTVIAEVLAAMNDSAVDGYHQRIAQATAALGRAMAAQRTEQELARLAPAQTQPDDDGSAYEQQEYDDSSWKSDVEGYFDNFQQQPGGSAAAETGSGYVDPAIQLQSTTNSTSNGVNSTTSNVRPPVSNVRPTTSNVRPTTPVSNVRPTMSNVRPATTTSIVRPATTVSNVRPTMSNVRPATTTSNVRPTMSNVRPATTVSNVRPVTTTKLVQAARTTASDEYDGAAIADFSFR